MTTVLRLALLAAVSTGITLAAPGPLITPVARPITVARPGLVRVLLDGDAQVMGAPGEWLRLVDPAGQRVALRALAPLSEGEAPVRVVSAVESPAGWTLTFDTGIVPVRHDRLQLAMSVPASASNCAIEAGDDLEHWTPLGRGSIFRLGDGAGLARSALSYPADTHRFLRVSWPRAAGFPQLERATVRSLDWIEALPTVTLAAIDIPGACGARVFTLPVRGLPVVRLVVDDLATDRSVSWRAAIEGRWEPARLDGGPLPGAALRFDGPRDARPVRAQLAPRWILFRAAAAGTYTLTRGAGETASAIDAGDAPIADIALGAARTEPAPVIDEHATKLAPVDQLPRHWTSYAVRPGDVAPGGVAEIVLPPEMFTTPGVGPENVRPMVADAVVPFVLIERAVPERLPVVPGAPVANGAESVYTLAMPAGSPAQLELAAARDAAEGGRADIRYRAVPRPGVPPEIRPGATSAFADLSGGCASALLDLAPPQGTTGVELAVTAPSGPPPRIEEAALWRPRHALRFAWPATGDVRLVSGFDAVRADAPQVVAVREQLLARPAGIVTVDLARTVAETERLARNSQRALIASLVVAGAVLLLILGRALTNRGASQPEH